jgi:hypothetical protein
MSATVDAGLHSRRKASGLTRYTLEEVEAALADAADALAEARAARAAAIEALRADSGWQRWHHLPAYWQYLDTPAARAAHEALRTDIRDGCPGFPAGDDLYRHLAHGGRNSRECYPLTRWAKTAARWRRWARRTMAALALTK